MVEDIDSRFASDNEKVEHLAVDVELGETRGAEMKAIVRHAFVVDHFEDARDSFGLCDGVKPVDLKLSATSADRNHELYLFCTGL